ncbi:FAH family protein [Arthrobacter sp. TPD3018]|uniref:AraD1 family protein n=1 Tax=Bacteria TaxID=2 RepID=UPI000D51DABC|nr:MULTISPECIES: AraD1 family protein [Bacteria]PVE59406.1 FAH family protein [Sphingomonas sp. TPD3009]PVE60926.1 FAH family protein [Arthrobacter sp. TPD3018]PVE87606.1 FAH family protein [Sphingomonas melonis]
MTAARLLQQRLPDGTRRVILAEQAAHVLTGIATTRELAQAAIREGVSLLDAARARRSDETVDLTAALEAGELLPAIDHPDSARLMLAGTGLTHLGSAAGRDAMHKAAAEGKQTDSMRLFLEGMEGGRPAAGAIGAQPEWFYKGDGQGLVAPEAAFASPAFAQDGGEEPELAGIYLIGDDGTPFRLGIALANEFSDHVTERHNYLWLAHSKLRQASLGAELLLGTPPADIRGTSRIVRDGATLWEKPFLTGEANMSHSLANLEYHHFKYAAFRRPGDIHVHFFGTATLSCADNVQTQDGDVFEIEAAPFTLPLRNALATAPGDTVMVKPL